MNHSGLSILSGRYSYCYARSSVRQQLQLNLQKQQQQRQVFFRFINSSRDTRKYPFQESSVTVRRLWDGNSFSIERICDWKGSSFCRCCSTQGIVSYRPLSSTSQSKKSTITTLDALEELVRSGALQPDKAQRKVAKRLTRLQNALLGYDNSVFFVERSLEDESSVRARATNDDETKSPTKENTPTERETVDAETRTTSRTTKQSEKTSKDAADKSFATTAASPPIMSIPRGLYIYGKVGTGKTMLMDSFYENTILPGSRKRRLHFHDFLSQIHSEIHGLKQKDLVEKGRNFSVDTSLANNPIHQVGLRFSSRVSLLCLDEFQVTDIADALILSQLFSVLFRQGTVVVATSNRPPSDLYEGGLNRSYFLPFIDLLERHCITHHIPSQRDYRTTILSNCSSFFLHQGGNNGGDDEDTAVEKLVSDMARELLDDDESGPTPSSMDLAVGFNRSIHVREMYGKMADGKNDERTTMNNMAVFSFDELCDADRGAGDYQAVARAFDIVVLKDVPTMDLEGHNRARRFITLIDELYEGKCALVCSSLQATKPADLFRAGSLEGDHEEEAAEGDDDDDDELSSSEMSLGIDVAQEGGTPVGALASVRELSFAFERSSSRIFEMCSRSWWNRVLGL